MADKSLQMLLFFAGKGWPVFPCTWLTEEGNCNCGNSSCNSPGKHPLIKGGFYGASTDAAQVTNWYTQYPLASWAMRTGEASGILVIDIDRKSGGLETWDNLRTDHPEAIETICTNTRNGGYHYWFELPEGSNFDSRAGIWPGIDIRAERGYIIVPPSAGYRFELSPRDAELAQLPSWILNHLTNGKPKKAAPPAVGNIPEGSRHQTLVEQAARLRNAGFDERAIEAALCGLRDASMETGEHPITDDELQDVLKWINGKEGSYALTDLGNAERFLALHYAKIRFCYPWNKWVFWDSRRWAADEGGEAVKLAHATIRAIYAEVATIAEEERRKALARHALSSEATNRMNSMLLSVKPYLKINPDELDKRPELVNVANGTIDLTTGIIQPHNPDLKISKLIDIEFNPRAACPRWEEFIKLVTGGDDDLAYFLQTATGYSLTGFTDEHALFFIYGSGKNGKSTFCEALRVLFGEYYTRTEVEALLSSFRSGEGATPHIAALKGIRLAMATEMPEGRKLNESLIKDLTGGDVITARYLFSNPFEFSPSHKLWMMGNYKPRIQGNDLGIWRRIKVIPFNTTITNPRPMSEVLGEFRDELPGILNWAVLGAVAWHSNKRLEMPEQVTKATEEYKTEMDLVSMFIDECCEMRPDYSCKRAALYGAWQSWCKENGEEDATRRAKRWFTTQLQSRGIEVGGHGDEDYKGIRFAVKPVANGG